MATVITPIPQRSNARFATHASWGVSSRALAARPQSEPGRHESGNETEMYLRRAHDLVARLRAAVGERSAQA